MLRYRILPVTDLEQNCSLVWCDETLEAAFIDPGGEAGRLLAAAEDAGVHVAKLWLTHGHLDHVGATAELAARLEVPVEGPQQRDAFWFDALPIQAQWFGLPRIEPFLPDRWLNDGDRVNLGNLAFEIIHCPGHTPGHVVFFQREARIAFVGDVLFHGSIGRTDFPQGDHAGLLAAIRNRLLPLGDDVQFVPGHGPVSTFGRERVSNPYLT